MSSDEDAYESSLAGQFLIAMPGMGDPRFDRTVIYMCAHGPDGAMGLVINKRADSLSFPDLMEQLGIDQTPGIQIEMPIQIGGPVEKGRGFVLHSGDYNQPNTQKLDENLGLTSTMDVLRKIAAGEGPEHALLALGYAGWSAGQLEDELAQNGWLHGPASNEVLFAPDIDTKWERALNSIGVDPSLLSHDAGHA